MTASSNTLIAVGKKLQTTRDEDTSGLSLETTEGDVW